MIYKIPVHWMMFDTMHIEADSLAEAIDKAFDAPLSHGYYIDESFEIDEESLRYEHPEEFRDEKISQILK